LKLKFSLYEFVKRYLDEREREYVLETGDFPFLAVDEVFVFDEDGNVIGKAEITTPVFRRLKWRRI